MAWIRTFAITIDGNKIHVIPFSYQSRAAKVAPAQGIPTPDPVRRTRARAPRRDDRPIRDKTMKLHHLRDLLAVAEQGTVSKAATGETAGDGALRIEAFLRVKSDEA